MKALILILCLCCYGWALKYECLTTDTVTITYMRLGKKCEDTCKAVYFDYGTVGGYKLELLNGRTIYVKEIKSVGSVNVRH